MFLKRGPKIIATSSFWFLNTAVFYTMKISIFQENFDTIAFRGTFRTPLASMIESFTKLTNTFFCKYLHFRYLTECVSEYIYSNAVKKHLILTVVFIPDLIINISGNIWDGSSAPVYFLVLALFHIVLRFFYFYILIYINQS